MFWAVEETPLQIKIGIVSVFFLLMVNSHYALERIDTQPDPPQSDYMDQEDEPSYWWRQY